MEGPSFSAGDRLFGAALALDSGCLANLLASAFLLAGTGSRSGSDFEADSEFISLELRGVDFFKSDSDSLISSDGRFGFGLLWMGVVDVGFWETRGMSALADLVVKQSSAPNPDLG